MTACLDKDEPADPTTPSQRAVADGQQALADWGEFAVTYDLGKVKDSFWTNGPQYKQLAKEAKAQGPGGRASALHDDDDRGRVLRAPSGPAGPQGAKVQMARPDA